MNLRSREPAFRCNSSRLAFAIACCGIFSSIRAMGFVFQLRICQNLDSIKNSNQIIKSSKNLRFPNLCLLNCTISQILSSTYTLKNFVTFVVKNISSKLSYKSPKPFLSQIYAPRFGFPQCLFQNQDSIFGCISNPCQTSSSAHPD